MRRTTIAHREKLKTAKSSEDRQELEADHGVDMQSLDGSLTGINDEELVAKAERMDLSLDDIPMPDCAPDERPGRWIDTDFGNQVLCIDSRRALQKAVRERAPAYRKERREIHELYLKVFLQIVAALTGIGGTIIGIIAILKK